MSLESKIVSRALRIGVVGLGYVGLPLCMEFCGAGYHVIGFDVDQSKVDSLREGRSYVPDVSSDIVSAQVAEGRFEPIGDSRRLSEVDSVHICVPTPLRKTKEPDLSYIVRAVEDLTPCLHKEMLVVLESTTYPGTTADVLVPAVRGTGLRVGEDVYLCFSPERVDPGNAVFNTKNTPKVVGGVTPKCTELGSLLYSQVVTKVVAVRSAEAAEMVKLLENTFRSVNIALVNEMALMCERMGIDIWEVIDAASTKPFGFMPFYPGPGIGGHCIPLDPSYLSWKARTYNFYNRFIDVATDINGNMPHHVVGLIGDVLNLEGKAISGSSLLCLGVAYKKDVGDIRESPSLDVIRLIRGLGCSVAYSDPWVPALPDGDIRLSSVHLTPDLIGAFDCVVLLTDHSTFDYEMIAGNARLILDTRNAFKAVDLPNIFRLGAPLPTPAEWLEAKRAAREAAPTLEDSRPAGESTGRRCSR
jgi:UDP-N-acetyl-D-glucosamine dehydrogenase